MSSSSTKLPASTSSHSTTTDAYRHTASIISASISRAATLTATSPLPKDILPSTPGYFSEKHEHEPKDHIVEIPDSPPEGSSHNPLTLFHAALGIPPPKPVKPSKPTKKNPHPDPPPVKQHKYHLCDSIATIAMFMQIVVGAPVIAFGAGSASRTLITVFGAANTALSSLLAVLKSQGLRELVEEKEREIEMKFSGRVGDGSKVELSDVWGIVKLIEGRYEAVRLTVEANRPDTYIPVPRK